MWGRKWFRKRQNKKAFRVISMNQGMQKIAPFSLHIQQYKALITTQKTVLERIVEKRQKEIQRIQPIHVQMVHLHLHPSLYTQPYMGKQGKVKGFSLATLRGEVKRLQYLGFLQEQEYFRTRPTMARSLFQKIMANKETHYVQGGEKVRPIHLEILKNVVMNDVLKHQSKPQKQIIEKEVSPHITYTFMQEIVREVSKQMRKDAWRSGGK